jgi:hypothetical protein
MRRLLLVLTCVVLSAARPVAAQTQSAAVFAGVPNQTSIWVLGEDGRLSAYDGITFRIRMSMAVPGDVLKHAEGLSISRAGMVLFAADATGAGPLRLWSSNNYAHQLTGGVDETLPSPGGGTIVTSASPVVFFSSDGQRLYWFENRFTQTQQQENISRIGRFLAWATDLQGESMREFLRVDFPRCQCDTGACEETCPQLDVWAPPSGISDFFYLTRWIPGQTDADYLETDLYQLAAGIWAPTKLAAPIDTFLDAADRGETYLAAVSDAGCCGWVNESDDVTYLVRAGRRIVIFDEFNRYHNSDYDVSFSTSNALLSPDVSRIAYTVQATQQTGSPIRLSSEGKSNPEELRNIQSALAELPRVELVSVSDAPALQLGITNAQLIGWLDNHRLLIFRSGDLDVVDAATGQVSATGLKAQKAAYVFIR